MILVTGATGHVGGEIVPLLLDLDKRVRVLTRDAGKVAHWGDRVECAVGSFDQPETLEPAMRSVAAMFLMTAEMGGAQQARNVIRAAERAGVKRIVYLSSLGAGDARFAIGRWHAEREDVIRASRLEWTFLRPGYFMSNAFMWLPTIKAEGVVYNPAGHGKTAPIDPRHIAAVAVLALTRAEHEGKVYELTGGELLTVPQQTEILSRVLGRPIPCVDISPEVAREGMQKSGLPAILADALAELYTAVRSGAGGVINDTFARVAERKPGTFEDWCRANAAAFR
jgi:uncharacterized protein YbjT (DUF2867 family)